MKVKATKETPQGDVTLIFESDNVGAINTSMTLAQIKAAIQVAAEFQGHKAKLVILELSGSYLEVSFLIEDAEQLYFAMNMLVQRSVINFNPITMDGVLFGEELSHNWTHFGGRIYLGESLRAWSLSNQKSGLLVYQPYVF